MKKVILIVLGLCLLSMAAYAHEGGAHKIDLKDVPQEIIDAVKEKVPGIEIAEVEMEVEGDYTEYEFEGEVDGEEYEVDVTVDADGKIVEIEVAGADDGDDEEEDDAGEEDEEDDDD